MDRSLVWAILLLVLGNNVVILSDSLIKLLDGFEAPFQFVLYRQLSATLMLLPVMLFFKRPLLPKKLRWHATRAHIFLLGTVFMVISLTTLPLATANAIFYAAPVITVVLARWLFKEKVTVLSLATAALGMVGVLVIINPTSANIFALAALIAATTLALNNLLIKKLPIEHGIIDTLYLTNLLGVPTATVLAIVEGAAFDRNTFMIAIGSSLFAMIYAGTCVYAYRAAESNKVTSAEYTGLIGAVLLGMLFFAEQPDARFYIGSLLIVVPLTLLTLKSRA
ncbi:EamA family transporter [Idiomarina sp. OT37-5b]|jgi:drug/metabolite transporter (DMT)-like permease|uniref:DMT family transporter n=1 Tax=Idiomarina sp. OT37-5b TaxID=2100422 RepID=UPI000CF8AA76|nr:DMT family transporter [Idiomarina sp. OT37-5b]AVJ56073.1 EamA family transporter [Idiomarina sp. OT37-5b]